MYLYMFGNILFTWLLDKNMLNNIKNEAIFILFSKKYLSLHRFQIYSMLIISNP